MDARPCYLLATLLGERESFTVSIDATSFGTFPISNEEKIDGSERVATLTHTRSGFELMAEGHYGFSEEGYESVSSAEKKTFREFSFTNGEDSLFLTLEGEGAYTGSLLYIRPSTLGFRTYHKWGFAYDTVLTIGSDPSCTFSYPDTHIAPLVATLTLHHTTFTLTTTDAAVPLYLNGKRVAPKSTCTLKPKDTLRLLDLVVFVFPRFIACNECEAVARHLPKDAVLLNFQKLAKKLPVSDKPYTPKPQKTFSPAPRLVKTARPFALSVEAPPQKKEPDDTPLLVRMGPSAVMGLASCFMGASAFVRILQGADVLTTAPSLAMCISLLVGMLVWPIVSRRYERRRSEEGERARHSAYESYLAHIEWRLAQERASQEELLKETHIAPSTCLKRAFTQDRHLFERTLQDEDALTLRVGTGDVPLKADISWPKRSFTLTPDPLLEAALALSEKPQVVREVPIAFDVGAYTVVGIAGNKSLRDALIRSLITQMATLVSPSEIKLAALLDPSKERLAKILRSLALTRALDGRTTLVATRAQDAHDLDLFFTHALGPRFAHKDTGVCVSPHYVVLVDATTLTSSLTILSRIARERPKGTTIIYTADSIEALPQSSECVVELKSEREAAAQAQTKHTSSGSRNSQKSRSRLFFARNMTATTRYFVSDTYPSEQELEDLSYALSHIHLQEQDHHFTLPSTLGFLESMGATSLETLDIERRWQEADATRSLAAPIGVDASGAPLILDAHEAADGPHGLVAGTTGSGKSELLVSWIASLCVNFPPEQVAFVLIDYKGGGLASAFTREKATLPHLAGTVTNLDGGEIARSLTSLRAELTRRQRLLDTAKRTTGEATMDALSYMRHFMRKDVTEPMPHLFIVADEFAELKQQEPDFMEGLISAARIGRALGVHLILATQKPSGVVSEQIAANSRFRVCLRVADAADSKEMLRRADAATLEAPGRLYLLVGYDERYTLGQASYAGTIYQEHSQGTDKTTRAELLSPTGRILDSISVEERSKDSSVTELDVTLQEIVRVAEGRRARRLWLDPLEAHPTLDALKKRYPNTQQNDAPWELNPVIGELDDPTHQVKRALTLPLSREGNAVIYGSVGTGAEELASTLVYSLLQDHSPRDLNLYILDFGSELLRSFEEHPCVGDVAVSDEAEKVRRLFDFLEKEIQTRRKTLARAKKSFGAYVQACEEPLPSILLILNGMGSFTELYESYEQKLVRVLRDGVRVGIYTVVIATSASEIRLRLRQGLKQYLSCELAHDDDYLQIFSNMRDISTPRGFGRGIIERENTKYLFQGAFIESEDEDKQEVIEELCRTSNSKNSVPSIALMPEHIHITDLHIHQKPSALAIGLYENNLEPLYLSCEISPIGRVFYLLPQTGREFVRSLDVLAKSEGVSYKLADIDCLLDNPDASKDTYTTDSFTLLSWLKMRETHSFELIVVTGIESVFSTLDDQTAIKLKEELGNLKRKGSRFVLFIDNAQNAASLREGWYLKHIGQGDGMWIGSGADSSIPFRVSYGSGDKMVGDIEADQGYTLTSGRARRVQFIYLPEEEME